MSKTFTVQRTTWMSWFSPLHCVELQDISRSHLVARPTPTNTVWGSLKQSFPSHTKQQVHNKGAGAGRDTNSRGGTSRKCVKSQVNGWEPHQGGPQLQAHGNKWQATHTYVVRLRWQCVVHVWMLYIVYADKCLKYPTYKPEGCSLTKIS